MLYTAAAVLWLASSKAKSAKCMCVTWLLTPNLNISSSVVTWSRTHVALLSQGHREECCPEQPLAQRTQLANRSPSPYKSCGITYQHVMVLHAQRNKLEICSGCLMGDDLQAFVLMLTLTI